MTETKGIMTKREWAATHRWFLLSDNEPVPPEPPEGDGWRLVAAVTCADGYSVGPIWYWERDVPQEATSE